MSGMLLATLLLTDGKIPEGRSRASIRRSLENEIGKIAPGMRAVLSEDLFTIAARRSRM
jgi:hypothetical protein